MSELDEIEGWYRRYGEPVHRRCRRLLGEDALAWDVTQEVFLRAHQRQRELRSAASILSWLLTVADRQCFSLLRRRRVALAAEDLLRVPAGGSEAALERMLIEADLVTRVLAHCPEDVQRIATHRFLDELEQEQIAALLGVSRKTVQRKLQTFHDTARRLLQASAA